VLTVMTVQVVPGFYLSLLMHWLLVAVAWLAPLSAAQYAWLTVKRVQAQEPSLPA